MEKSKKESLKKKAVSNMDTLVRSAIIERFKLAEEEIKQVIIDRYDEDLVDVVVDRESKSNPNFYREDFVERLDSFVFVEEADDEPAITVPDMENFDFSGRLRVIETIMNGTAGLYVEVDEKQYKTIFNNLPVNQTPLDEYVSPAERIYLVRYSAKVRSAEKANKKPFVRYPFSNMPPIDILGPAQEFADQSVEKWVSEAIAVAVKKFAINFKGVRI